MRWNALAGNIQRVERHRKTRPLAHVLRRNPPSSTKVIPLHAMLPTTSLKLIAAACASALDLGSPILVHTSRASGPCALAYGPIGQLDRHSDARHLRADPKQHVGATCCATRPHVAWRCLLEFGRRLLGPLLGGK